MIKVRTIDSPLGPLTIREDDGAITALWWKAVADYHNSPLLDQAADELGAYFRGDLRAFNVPVAPSGTAFQRRVWHAMCSIPYGETWTYGEMAVQAGGSPRAVGMACGANPIPIIVPCHRVTAAGGRMGGYSGAGGVGSKRHLLELEGWPGITPGPLFAAAAAAAP